MCSEQAQADPQTAESASIGRRFGKYKPIAMIGRGGMGDIYLAMASGPAGFKKLVVVKCLRTTTDDDDGIRQMFLDEGRLAAHLNHPNVVQIFDVGDADGSPYIAMEYLDGQPLSKIRRTLGRLSPPIAARIASDVLAGLHYAHELRGFDGTPLNLVHRDLSPPNILITYDGVVKLLDFGIAKAALPSRALTDVGTLKGKISYMAPEQASHNDFDRRVDIFAMGVVLWELIVGRRLVTDSSPAAALRHLVYGSFPAISTELPEIDGALSDIVAHALEKEPDARYSTALEMREDLEAYLARCGAMVRREELAELVVGNFAVQRAQMQEVIQACTSAVDAVSGSRLPVLPRCGIAGDSSSLSMGSRVLPLDESLSAANPTGLGGVSRLRRWGALVPQRNRRVMLGGVALAFTGLALGAWRWASSESVPEPQEAVALSASVVPAPAAPSKELAAQAPPRLDVPVSESSQSRQDAKSAPAPIEVSRRNHSGRANTRSAVSASANARVTRTTEISSPRTVAEPSSAASSPASAESAVTHSAKRTVPQKRAPLVDDHPRVQLVD